MSERLLNLMRGYGSTKKIYPDSFTAKYNCDKLVYYLVYSHIEEAIAAEKVLKGSSRKYKQQLVNSFNPDWNDLYDSLFD